MWLVVSEQGGDSRSLFFPFEAEALVNGKLKLAKRLPNMQSRPLIGPQIRLMPVTSLVESITVKKSGKIETDLESAICKTEKLLHALDNR